MIALLALYARDLLGQAAAIPRDGRVQRFWLCVLVAFLPAALVGVLLRGWIKTVLFASPGLIATSFILGGIVDEPGAGLVRVRLARGTAGRAADPGRSP